MLLKRLCEAMGISGQEAEVRAVIREELGGKVDEMRCDTMGNVIVRKGPEHGPRVMLAAHMDEVGLMISGITKEGCLRFVKAGGTDDRVILSKVVLVGKSRIPGVIGPRPHHLETDKERETPVKSDKLYIDIGCKSREEAESKVKLGDPVIFDTSFAEFGEGYVKGRALDDRIGCAVLVEILKQDWSIPVWGVFTSQEEVGCRGATIAAYSIQPEMGIALEGTVSADVAGVEDEGLVTQPGNGPAIGIMDAGSIPNRHMLAQVVSLAKQHGVPFQFRRTTTGGNDAGPIQRSQGGSATVTISVPCKNIHSPVAIASVSDFDNCVRLVGLFLKSVEGGFRV